LEADVKDHSSITLDAVHQAEGRVTQLTVLDDVFRGVERGPLLLPLVGGNPVAVDLELEEVALELVEPGRKRAHFA
jgi:hypothetical protein